MPEPEPPPPLRFLRGEGEWEGWLLVWHEVGGRLREVRFRESELPALERGIAAFYAARRRQEVDL